MVGSEKLSASLEDYLEAIYHIVMEKQAARAKDIAQRLQVNNSSVTGALRSLSEKGYINYAPYDLITLTLKGKRHAQDVVRRHEALKNFFVKVLRIEEDEAENAACQMEHALSNTIMDRLFRFVEFIEICPRGGEDWVAEFWNEAIEGTPYEHCEACINKALKSLQQKKKELNDGSAKPVSLKLCKTGQKGKIVKIKGRSNLNKRLKDYGIVEGSIIEVAGVASSGDAIDIKCRGYQVSLSIDEALKIMLAPMGKERAEQ